MLSGLGFGMHVIAVTFLRFAFGLRLILSSLFIISTVFICRLALFFIFYEVILSFVILAIFAILVLTFIVIFNVFAFII